MDTLVERTTKMEKASYGSWFFGQNIIYMVVTSYLAIFLTDEVGILEAVVGTLFLVARIWDAINDPILGGVVDKYQPKKGKFMPWINAVTIFLPIITIFLFWNFNGNGTFNIVYAYLSYIIWGMLYTISDVPIFALATTMTEKTYERTKLIAIGRLAAGVASMLIGLIAPVMIVEMGYTLMVVIFMGISLLVMIPLRFFVKERVIKKRERPVTLKTMFKAVFNNKYLLIFYLSYIAVNTTFTTMTIAPYFAKWNLGNLELLTTIYATLAVPMIIIPIILPAMVKKFGKYKIFMTGLGVSIVFSILQYFVGYDLFILFLIINFVRLTGLLLPMTMNGMFSADCVEYGAYVTGERNEGVTFSVQTFSTKLGSAFSAALALFVISAYGYVGTNLVQSSQALQGIWVALTLVPVLGLIIAFIIFGFMYKLNEEDVEKMVVEMKKKDDMKVKKE
ncbi:glycoside-pentoside-hexuronide (GPH):cation symporter [Mycoplasmatota bacterium]|nr:glycoside-pentoside-hexuronide (GPH):cation symporter [Mycoplasmatota bacterium]